MVEIRTANEKDIPEIVNLLKISLGEGLMPKSEAFWRWKHVDNPFGPSPVLVAEHKGQLIGVRAFMRWEWRYNGKMLKAVRAVDTATHPSYQGRGIFSKLTLALVDQCRSDEINFIFNTPNDKSRPGYLKMGWQHVGRMPITIGIPFYRFTSVTSTGISNFSDQFTNPGFQNLLDQHAADNTQMITNYSLRYLHWRYLENPNVTYLGNFSPSGVPSFLFICRFKKTRVGTELRICEALGLSDKRDGGPKDLLWALAKHVRATFVTGSGNTKLPLLGAVFPVGPRVTAMSLRLGPGQPWENFDHWQPSLGDMEIF